MTSLSSPTPPLAGRKRGRRGRAVFFLVLVAALLVSGGCGSGDDDALIDADALLSDAVVSFPPEESSAPPLGRILDIETPTPDSVLIFNRSAPFLRFYSLEDGFLDALGPEGDGPGELDVPQSAAVRGDRLWILSSWMMEWSWSSPEEEGRHETPPKLLKLVSGCGGELLGVYLGEEPGTERALAYGIQRYRDSTWQKLSPIPALSNPLVVHVPGNQPLATGASVVFVGPGRGLAKALGFYTCEGELRQTVSLPRPEMWPEKHTGAVFPRGIVPLDDHLAVLYAWTLEADTTLVALWDPERGQLVGEGAGDVRMIRGDISFHAPGDSLVWAVSYHPAPRVSAVRKRRLAELLLPGR